MTTLKEAQNEVVHVQVETVEGEYVSPTDYRIIQIEQMKAAIEDQKLRAEEIRAKIKADERRRQQEILLATLNMGRWWREQEATCTDEKYQYYWEKQKRQKGYKKIKNIDQIVFWAVMIPMLAAYLLIYIGYTAAKIGAW
ncbi:hypothetical protein [Acinetobacter baumannii]|uniref:hypothetical protein n=1 Tax=Acinetobacter baumannii TaxID=470 RepID=UPI00292BA7DE|nr:hypothetical protein [Acinetobacter baumannii]HEC0297254.1 hypothetical protein [Acinetobacter baumannii]